MNRQRMRGLDLLVFGAAYSEQETAKDGDKKSSSGLVNFDQHDRVDKSDRLCLYGRPAAYTGYVVEGSRTGKRRTIACSVARANDKPQAILSTMGSAL